MVNRSGPFRGSEHCAVPRRKTRRREGSLRTSTRAEIGRARTTYLEGECSYIRLVETASTSVECWFSIPPQDGHCEQALDRDWSTAYLVGECSYRHADEEGMFNVGRVLVLNDPPCRSSLGRISDKSSRRWPGVEEVDSQSGGDHCRTASTTEQGH